MDEGLPVTEAEAPVTPSDLNYAGPILCSFVGLFMTASQLSSPRNAREFFGGLIVFALPVTGGSLLGFLASKWAKTRRYWGWFFFLGWLASIVAFMVMAWALLFRNL